MTEIDIAVQYPAWDTACPDCEALIKTAIQATLEHSPIARTLIETGHDPEISVVLANDDLVHSLNRDYRDNDKPTNILSFAMLDGENGWEMPAQKGLCALGDLILAFETIQKESAEASKPLEDHLAHLIVHGTLHLLGYDHIDDGQAEKMESLEIHILDGLNIKNPYNDR